MSGILQAIASFNEPTAEDGIVSWTGTQNATVAAPHITHNKAGYVMYANSVESISSGAAESFSFEGASSTASGWTNHKNQYLKTAAGAPYTSGTGYKLRVNINGAGTGAVYKDGAYVDDLPGTFSLGDTVTMGFDGSNHLQVTKNGSPIWTDGSTTTTADYILFIEANNEETTIKWENVIYQ